MATVQELKKRIEFNDARYNVNFAGHSRISRNPALLQEMIAAAQEVTLGARGLRNGGAADRDALLAEATRQIELYKGEYKAIIQAKEEGGPLALEASTLGTRANYIFHRYTRHFAGQSRSSRDATLMQDMLTELEAIDVAMREAYAQRPMAGLQADIQVVAGRLEQFRTERKNIAEARIDGTQDEQASQLANAANHLFAHYRSNFAGQPRVTRRPELLVRLIEALRNVDEMMQALKDQGFHDEHNDGNLAIVRERHAGWQKELIAVRAERQKTSMANMVSSLETAANAELGAYAEHFAGHSRKTRDLQQLCDIIDRLDEVERQMTRLDTVQPSDANELNLTTVRDALTQYQNEYDEIAKVQAAR